MYSSSAVWRKMEGITGLACLFLLFASQTTTLGQMEGSYRLTNGTVDREGRIEMFMSGAWTGRCEPSWNITQADFVCSAIGMGLAIQALRGDVFGVSSPCNGTSQVGVVCSGPDTRNRVGFTRFSQSSEAEYEGYPELAAMDGFGLFCGSPANVSRDLGVVLCRSMGFLEFIAARTDNISGSEGTELRWITQASCDGSERNIKGCILSVEKDCPSQKVVYIECARPNETLPSLGPEVEDVRLADGNVGREGRVEFLRNGIWQSVCDYKWNWRLSNIICRTLGFGFAVGQYRSSLYGRGNNIERVSPPLHCQNESQSINFCTELIPPSNNTCSHDNEVGIICSGVNTSLSNGDVRLTDSTELYSGRVEVYYNSRWYHAHVNEWTSRGGEVACRAMGFERVVNSSFTTTISTQNDCFTSLPCTGDEYNFNPCFNPLPSPCLTGPDVGIQCAGILGSIQQPPVTPVPTATPRPTITTSSEPVRLDLVLGLFLGVGIFLLLSLGLFCFTVVVVLCKMKKKTKAEYELRPFDM